MNRTGMWKVPEIAGYAARVAKLDFEEINFNREIEWGWTEGLYQYNTPREIYELTQEVYSYWVPLDEDDDEFHLIEGTPNLENIKSKVGMIMRQLTHSTEVIVDVDQNLQPYVAAHSLRAKLALEMTRDLHNAPVFGTCRHCGGWFPIKRRGAMYCSGRCQTAWWREHKEGK